MPGHATWEWSGGGGGIGGGSAWCRVTLGIHLRVWERLPLPPVPGVMAATEVVPPATPTPAGPGDTCSLTQESPRPHTSPSGLTSSPRPCLHSHLLHGQGGPTAYRPQGAHAVWTSLEGGRCFPPLRPQLLPPPHPAPAHLCSFWSPATPPLTIPRWPRLTVSAQRGGGR